MTDIARLGLAVDNRPVDATTKSLARLDNQAARTDRAANKLSRSASGMGESFERAKRLVMASAVAFAYATARIGTAALKAASDVEEMRSKFNVVFGSLSGEVEEWATTHASAVGRSRFELQEYAARLQDTFVPLGFARDKAAELSKQLVTLSVDVASFNNEADPAVLQAFTSALVGSHEAVRRFGIVITESSLKAELLSMGVKGGTQSATEQQKAMARLNIIIKSTSDAHGDAARTADSYANRQKALAAEIRETAVVLGQELMPFAKEFLSWAIDVAKALRGNDGVVGVLKSQTREFRDMGKALDDMTSSPSWYNFWNLMVGSKAASALAPISAEFKKLRDASLALNDLPPKFTSPAANDNANSGPPVDQKLLDSKNELIAALQFEEAQLARTAIQQEIYNNLNSVGVERTSALGQEIAAATEKLFNAQTAQAVGDQLRSPYEQMTLDLDRLKAAQEAGVISADQFRKAQFMLAAGTANKYAQMASAVGNALGSLFEDNKGVAIAQALINTYAGITQALASYPPPVSYGYAAAVAATGFAQVAKIRSTTKGSGGGGGGISSASSAVSSPAAAQQPGRQRAFHLNLQGLGRDKKYSFEEIEQIITGIEEVTEDGGGGKLFSASFQ